MPSPPPTSLCVSSPGSLLVSFVITGEVIDTLLSSVTCSGPEEMLCVPQVYSCLVRQLASKEGGLVGLSPGTCGVSTSCKQRAYSCLQCWTPSAAGSHCQGRCLHAAPGPSLPSSPACAQGRPSQLPVAPSWAHSIFLPFLQRQWVSVT